MSTADRPKNANLPAAVRERIKDIESFFKNQTMK